MAFVLLQIGIIYFLGHLFAYMFKKYKVPDVLLFMCLGLLLGPVLKIVTPADFGGSGQVLSTLALVVILFESGTTLNMRSLAASFFSGSLLTLSTALITGALAALFSMPFTDSSGISLLIGLIAAGTSSAVVIPMASALGLSEHFKNVLILESSLTDVICIVLTLAATRALSVGSFEWSAIASQIVLSFVVALLIGAISGLAWIQLKEKINAQFATIAFAILIYAIVELAGFSGPIAVMAMGVTLANGNRLNKHSTTVSLSPSESSFYLELVFVLKTFFFIYLGISMTFDNLLLFPVAIVLVVGVIVLRSLLVKGLWRSHPAKKELAYVTLLMPKGLAAAVLAAVPLQAGLAGAEIVPQFVFTLVLVSIVIVSVLIPIASTKIKDLEPAAPADIK